MKQKGFSLIELVIVVAIIAILSAIAYPSYQKHTQKSKRTAAQQVMMEYANKQEQYMLDARAYTGTASDLIDPATIPSEVTDNYDIVIGIDNGATPPSYTITATPKGAMAGTSELTLDSQGQKTPPEKW